MEEIEYEEAIIEPEEENVDEDEIDAEINQSMLNSLVEGMLIESVRRGVIFTIFQVVQLRLIFDLGLMENYNYGINKKMLNPKQFLLL